MKIYISMKTSFPDFDGFDPKKIDKLINESLNSFLHGPIYYRIAKGQGAEHEKTVRSVLDGLKKKMKNEKWTKYEE